MVWVQGPFLFSSSGGVKAPSRALLSWFVFRIQKEQLLVPTGPYSRFWESQSCNLQQQKWSFSSVSSIVFLLLSLSFDSNSLNELGYLIQVLNEKFGFKKGHFVWKVPLKRVKLKSKNLKATHTWKFLTFPNFLLRKPIWKKI